MRVVVVGAGVAGIAFMENLEKVSDLEVCVVEKQEPPFRKYLLLDWLVDKVSDSDFFILLDKLKENLPFVKLINDKAVRVNFDKKKIFFKENQPLDFDTLVFCCGLKPGKMDFPGVFREGVHYLADPSPGKLKDNLKIFSNIIVYVETLSGIELAIKLSSLEDKEIKVVAANFDFLPDLHRPKLLDIFKEKSIDVYLSQQITEVLGESRIKASKLSSGKFLACDVLILDTQCMADTDIVRDNPQLVEKNALKVNQHLSTDFNFCFGCGDMINPNIDNSKSFTNNRESASRQARLVARNIQGGRETFSFQDNVSLGPALDRVLGLNEDTA